MEAAISEISADLGKQVISWSCTEGLIKGGKRVAAANRVNPHTLFFVCPVLYIPDELQKDITYVGFPNPRESVKQSGESNLEGTSNQSLKKDLMSLADWPKASSYVPEEIPRAEVGLAREIKHVKRETGH